MNYLCMAMELSIVIVTLGISIFIHKYQKITNFFASKKKLESLAVLLRQDHTMILGYINLRTVFFFSHLIPKNVL